MLFYRVLIFKKAADRYVGESTLGTSNKNRSKSNIGSNRSTLNFLKSTKKHSKRFKGFNMDLIRFFLTLYDSRITEGSINLTKSVSLSRILELSGSTNPGRSTNLVTVYNGSSNGFKLASLHFSVSTKFQSHVECNRHSASFALNCLVACLLLKHLCQNIRPPN